METSFLYSPEDKALSFKLKERVKTANDIELRGNGLLNPSSGRFTYNATAKKNFSSENSFGTTKVGAGVFVTQKSVNSLEPSFPILRTSVKQHIPLNNQNTSLVVKGRVDLNLQNQEFIFGKSSAYVSQKIPNLTASQDVQIKAGFDFVVDPYTKNVKQGLRFQARENNWALNYRSNRWSVTYDL
uniref:Uncharacterized protein n=1 Tax=Polytomella parva TaxID=51329 RepID=A0A7S0UJV7_9CHLO|mmetsp:Transcript_11848/g.21268  ORF Transcript_11848/g.21268 Transcript_11848/m.21268 type:complete len:185 (+) Transcript_11848:60-614(+)